MATTQNGEISVARIWILVHNDIEHITSLLYYKHGGGDINLHWMLELPNDIDLRVPTATLQPLLQRFVFRVKAFIVAADENKIHI